MNTPQSNENKMANTEKADEGFSATFVFLRHYVKDLSLEFPSAPDIFTSSENSNLQLNLNAANKKIADKIYEVELMVNVTVAGENQKTLLLIECKYAGLFEIDNVPEKELEVLLNVHTLEIIFPYLRETVSNLSMRSSLQPILLPPTNFVDFYQQGKQSFVKN